MSQDKSPLCSATCVDEKVDEKFVVRFPNNGLRGRIAEVAKAGHRSMNAEIVRRMEITLHLESEVERLKAVIDQLLAGQSVMPRRFELEVRP